MWCSMKEATDLEWHEDECIMASFQFRAGHNIFSKVSTENTCNPDHAAKIRFSEVTVRLIVE